jgi:hypothetical protein
MMLIYAIRHFSRRVCMPFIGHLKALPLDWLTRTTTAAAASIVKTDESDSFCTYARRC